MYLKGKGEIDLTARCKGDDSPYRWWFWVKGNKLRSSGIHWSTDSFVATTKPLTGSYNTNQYENRVSISRLEASGGKFIKSKGRDLTINGAKWGISFYIIDLNSKLLFLHF